MEKVNEPPERIAPERAPRPGIVGRPVVLVPYYASIKKECEEGLRALVKAGVALSRFSLSSIDLLRSAMLSHAYRTGYDQFLFIDADIGFDAGDALRLLARPEPVVAGIYVHNKGMIRQLELPECHWGSIKGIYPFFLPLCVADGRGGTRYLTEDYSFSHRLSQIGITPLADTSIRLAHFKKYGFTYDDLRPRSPVSGCTVEISYKDDGDHP
jgi:hypothetical protein